MFLDTSTGTGSGGGGPVGPSRPTPLERKKVVRIVVLSLLASLSGGVILAADFADYYVYPVGIQGTFPQILAYAAAIPFGIGLAIGLARAGELRRRGSVF